MTCSSPGLCCAVTSEDCDAIAQRAQHVQMYPALSIGISVPRNLSHIQNVMPTKRVASAGAALLTQQRNILSP